MARLTRVAKRRMNAKLTLTAKINAYSKANTTMLGLCGRRSHARDTTRRTWWPVYDRYAIVHGVATLATELADKAQSAKLTYRQSW